MSSRELSEWLAFHEYETQRKAEEERQQAGPVRGV